MQNLNGTSLHLDTGKVYKVVQWWDASGESQSILLDVYDITPNESIRLMEISRKVRFFLHCK